MSSEYLYWMDFFKSKRFKKNLIKLKKKLKNKRVVFYCNGIYFDALTDVYNLSEYFTVSGISDIRYENKETSTYKNYNCIKPSELINADIDYIIVSSPNPDFIKKYLLEKGHKNILPLYKERKHIFSKAVKALEYFAVTKNIPKALKYYFFCTKEELNTKINYEKVLMRLRTKRNTGNKIKIVFACEENQKWGYQFVYELMKKDSRFEVLPVVLYPIITKNRVDFTQPKNIEFFKTQGIEAIDGYDYEKKRNIDLKKYEPDIVFYQQPWYLQGENHPVNLSKYALTIMIPYGYTTLNENDWGSDAVKRVYSNLWMFFSESPYHNKFYEKAAGMRNKDNLTATGTPKLDYYRKPVNQEYEKLWKGRKNRIIWAPHHSINNQGLSMSNFQEYYAFLLEFAKKHNEYSFIVKPHPALRSTCISSGFMKEAEYDAYMNEWNSLKNASVYTDGAYFDIFKTSDVLVTDCSSFLAEYFPSEKPIILLDRPTRAPFDEFGKKLESGFYKVQKPTELPELFYKLLVEKEDILATTRRNILKEYFYLPENGASYNIINNLKNISIK